MAKDRIQWHSPFRGAVKVELSEYSDILQYEDERLLTKEPLSIDLLVIKKKTDIQVDHPIGNIFREWNILEYKSPTDYIAIDDFYKGLAYAYLLKFDAACEDGIKFTDITISFISTKVPEKLFKHLENERGYIKTLYKSGIYYFNRQYDIPIQFLIQEDLGDLCKWLSALNFHVSEERFHSLLEDYKKQERNENMEVVINAIIDANSDLFKEGQEMRMSKEVRQIFRPDLEDAEVKGKAEGKAELIAVIKKKRLRGWEASSIAEILEVDEDYVREVVALIDQFPQYSAIEISKKMLFDMERQLA